MVSNRLGDKKGTNLSNIVRFNEAMKTRSLWHPCSMNFIMIPYLLSDYFIDTQRGDGGKVQKMSKRNAIKHEKGDPPGFSDTLDSGLCKNRQYDIYTVEEIIGV